MKLALQVIHLVRRQDYPELHKNRVYISNELIEFRIELGILRAKCIVHFPGLQLKRFVPFRATARICYLNSAARGLPSPIQAQDFLQVSQVLPGALHKGLQRPSATVKYYPVFLVFFG